MKKYKLIKEYPGSPKVGYIGTDYDFESNYKPSNYPEFWEEVIEKDYEILAFKYDERIDTLRENGLYGISTGNPTNIQKIGYYDISGYSSWNIYKVKRLSDCEVFTIDDLTNNGTVYKFKEVNNMIRVYFKEKPDNYHVNLNTLSHSRPLLKTFDGIDLGIECKYWHVVEYSRDIIPTAWEPLWSIVDKKCIQFCALGAKQFSSKQAAEKYIEENKPKYSEKDIIDFGTYLKTAFVEDYTINSLLRQWNKLKNKK